MALRDIIGIGGSAGSTEALKEVLSRLPAGLQASIFITTHLRAGRRQYLAEVLQRGCALPVQVAEESEAVLPGRIYLATPEAHLLVLKTGVMLGMGPRENMVRPAIDPMLRSLAMTYGPRVIGVILSGALNDGASGLLAIKQCGGVTVVQSLDDAQAPDMPEAAIEAAEPDHIATASTIGALLAGLVGTEAPHAPPCPIEVRLEVEIAAGARLGSDRLRRIATPVALSCPNCHGVLSEVADAKPLRYRCQIGHAVTGEMLTETKKEETEEALRLAMRVMEERAELVDRMGKDAHRQGRSLIAELYEGRHKEYAAHAEILRKAVLAGLGTMVEDEVEGSDPESA